MKLDKKWIIGTSVTIVGMLASVWVYLGLPRPAHTGDLAKLEVRIAGSEQIGKGAYALILVDREAAAKARIAQARAQLRQNPADEPALIRLQEAEQSLGVIREEMRKLGIRQ